MLRMCVVRLTGSCGASTPLTVWICGVHLRTARHHVAATRTAHLGIQIGSQELAPFRAG
jgi:hypothetical protein